MMVFQLCEACREYIPPGTVGALHDLRHQLEREQFDAMERWAEQTFGKPAEVPRGKAN